jgi:hypothetical protein
MTAASPAADVASLVGAGLPLRVGLGSVDTATLSLQDNRLAAVAADDEPDVFLDPLAFGVELGPLPDEKPKPRLQRLPPWPNGQGLDLTESSLKITVPLVVTVDTDVLVLISRGQFANTQSGKILAGTKEVTFQVQLTKGDEHGVLVLVAGQAGRFEKKQVA